MGTGARGRHGGAMTTAHRTTVIVVGPGEGRRIPGPENLTLKAGAEHTGGAIGVLEGTTPAGFAPPPHIHHDADELFYVLGGAFRFLLGEDTVEAPAGSFVYVPRGTVHQPEVIGPEPGRVLVAFVPGGQERAFDDFAALAAAGGDLTGEQAQAIARRYHSEFVELPR